MKREIGFAAALILTIWLIWYANGVFLLSFASILIAIFLNAVGRGMQKLTRLYYPLALIAALILILGFFALTFWLYSPLISEQFQLLMNQLPQALETLRSQIFGKFGVDFLSQESLRTELDLTNSKLLTNLVSIFSTTVGTLATLAILIIVGLYLAFDPGCYIKWILKVIPESMQEKMSSLINQIGSSLRWWLLGKLVSMVLVGITTFIGLNLLHVSLALILGFLAALLTFIPYVGAIIAAIPAILVGFAQSPLTALYVIILYVCIHAIDGYLITPFVEQRTVSIPPAITIMAQVLMTVLLGGIGLALATPLAVVAIAWFQARSSLKVT